LRTSAQPTDLQLPLDLAQGGFFDVALVAMGNPIKVRFDNHLEITVAGKAYLENMTLPPVYLPAGNTQLTIALPPRSGLDRIQLMPRQTDLAALSEAAQLTITAEPPTPTDLDSLSVRLAAASR
jgi:hypothetical protein